MLAYIIRLALLALSLAVLPGFGSPAVARAWTEAQVTSASALLDITEPDRARIELEVGVHVSAGWLAHFELLDLDENLLPSQNPAEFVGVDGRVYTPTTSVPKAGSVVFEFADKHVAPRRGDYRLHFSYTKPGWRLREHEATGPVAGPGRVVTWSLPRWPVRLANVCIRVLAPKGTRPAYPDDREGSGDEVSLRDATDGVELAFRRVELPRTQAFSVSLELLPAQPTAARLVDPGLGRGLDRASLLLGLLLGALWLAKRQSTRVACRHEGLRPRLLVDVATTQLRDCCGLALCVAAVPLFGERPILAAIGGVLGAALCITLGFTREATPHVPASQVQRPARPRYLSALYGMPAADWLDITRPAGCCACLGYGALLAWSYPVAPTAVPCAAWLAAPLFFTATRAARRRASLPNPAHGESDSRRPAQAAAARPLPKAAPVAHGLDQTLAARERNPVLQGDGSLPDGEAHHGHAHHGHASHGHAQNAVAVQPAFLRSSSTTVSSSLSSRPTTSGCGSKSTSAACSSS